MFFMKRLMPLSALLILLSSPVAAWEAGVSGALCTLRHVEDAGQVLLTFDPSVPLYTISISGAALWDVADTFGITFAGPQPNTITTARHVLSPDLAILSVSDQGFGNVLDGIALNASMTAGSGASEVSFSLEGAAPEVAVFRACGQTPSV